MNTSSAIGPMCEVDAGILSVIIVNYNTGDHLMACVRSLYENVVDVPMEVIIIDNASTDESISPVRESFNDIDILLNPNNVGFAVACNQGICRARGGYLLLLNPDTIVQPRAVQETLAFLKRTPEAGLVGCRLLDSNGNVERSCRTFPTTRDYLFDGLFLTKIFPRSKLFGRFYLTNTTFVEPTEVDMVLGAFFLFKRSVLEDIGPLDERFFIYTEERDYCYRAKAAGWKVYYYPRAEIIHIGGVSTRQQEERMFIEQKKSTLKFHRKHDSARQVAVIRRYLLLGIFLRLLIWSVLSAVRGTARAKDKQRIYSAATRWFLTEGRLRENSSHQ